jgi:molybdate transport system ATP-binding protein
MLEVAIHKRLRDFALDAAFDAADQLVVLFGPSGSGKTVTLRSIVGILRPDAGYVRIGGEAVFDAARGIDVPIQRRRVGYVPQSYGLFPHLTVGENVAYGLAGLPRAEARARVAEALERLELADLERRRPRELSGGQQQRVALARALVTRPRALLLDEPFAALDAPLRARLRRDLLQIHRQVRIPTLFISHDLGEAYMLAEKMVVYDRGHVLQIGSREDVFRRPASARVAQLTGASNVFAVAVAAAPPPAAPLSVALAPVLAHVLPTPSPDSAQPLVALRASHFTLLAPHPGDPLPARAEACVRPEAIAVEPAGALAGPPNRLPARIVDENATGVYYTLYCELLADRGTPGVGDASAPVLEVLLPVQSYEALGLRVGRECTLVIPPAAVHVIPAPAR